MPLDKPKDSPLLSIIMPVYNAEKYVAQAIQSIIDQTFQNWELLICDDRSTDKSWIKINRFNKIDSRITLYQNEHNQGKVKTTNGLLENCKGRYLTIHDADDWSEKERFEKQIEFLELNQDYIGCGCNFNSIRQNQTIRSKKLEHRSESIKTGLLKESQIHGPTLVFRGSFAKESKLIYRPFFETYNEDYDLCVRLSNEGRLSNIKDYLYNYRILDNSLSKAQSSKRSCSKTIVKHLAEQRFNNGFDDIDREDYSYLNALIESKSHEYEKDKTLLLREQSEILYHNKFYKKSFNLALAAFLKEPLNFKNLRLIQYIIKSRILSN